ncbi:MAG TPA: hypothetical protein VF257_02640 [Solirubrobacteraceae bacterium]
MRGIQGIGAALAAAAASAALAGAAQAAPSTWQCGASAVSISTAGNPAIAPVTANASPCVSNTTGADSVPAGAGVPSSTLSAQTLSATTIATPADEIPARQGVGAIGRVENLGLQLPPGSGTTAVGIREATARAAAVCVNGRPVLDGSSDVNGATLNGQAVPIEQLGQQLATQLAPLGDVVDLKYDEQVRSGSSLVVRALHLRVLSAAGAPVVDVVAGEARVASTGAVCDPTGQVRGSGASGNAGAGGAFSRLANGVRGGSCGRLTMYFVRNHKTSFGSRYGRRAVVRGRIVNCKGKSIVRARIDVIHVIKGKRHLIKTGLRSREGGKLTLILPSNIKTRDLRFEYRGNLLSTKVTARSKLHITVRNRHGRVLR